MELKALETQINEFGQTPAQLFHHPHPPRLVIPPTPDPATVFATAGTAGAPPAVSAPGSTKPTGQYAAAPPGLVSPVKGVGGTGAGGTGAGGTGATGSTGESGLRALALALVSTVLAAAAPEYAGAGEQEELVGSTVVDGAAGHRSSTTGAQGPGAGSAAARSSSGGGGSSGLAGKPSGGVSQPAVAGAGDGEGGWFGWGGGSSGSTLGTTPPPTTLSPAPPATTTSSFLGGLLKLGRYTQAVKPSSTTNVMASSMGGSTVGGTDALGKTHSSGPGVAAGAAFPAVASESDWTVLGRPSTAGSTGAGAVTGGVQQPVTAAPSGSTAGVQLPSQPDRNLEDLQQLELPDLSDILTGAHQLSLHEDGSHSASITASGPVMARHSDAPAGASEGLVRNSWSPGADSASYAAHTPLLARGWGPSLPDRLHKSDVSQQHVLQVARGSQPLTCVSLWRDDQKAYAYCGGAGGLLRVMTLPVMAARHSGGTVSQPVTAQASQLRAAQLDGDVLCMGALHGVAGAAASHGAASNTRHPTLLVGCHNRQVHAYCVETGRVVGSWEAHDDAVCCIAVPPPVDRSVPGGGPSVSPPSSRLLTSSWDCSVKVGPVW